MRHNGCTENATGLIEAMKILVSDKQNEDCTRTIPLGLDDGRGRKISSEDLANRCSLDQAELDAEADNDAEHQGHDEEFEGS